MRLRGYVQCYNRLRKPYVIEVKTVGSMKLLSVFFLTIYFLQLSECSLRDYIQDIPVVGTIAKETIHATDYVIRKGRQFKNKITSYFGPDEKHTYSEAEIQMSTPKLLAYHGYPSETHTIVTDDGYILTIHRIPYSKHAYLRKSPDKTVLLHHGILGSSADWILAGPQKGLAYILSDSGYDVWMANVRGNTYSRAHISRSVKSYAFWNFTFHEVGQYDLPAVIDYITDVKDNVKINYVGFSMGTTVLFSLLSTKPEYNDILNAAFVMAPIAYMRNVRSPIRLLAKYSNDMEYFLKMFGANELLATNEVLKWLSKYTFKLEPQKRKGILSKNLFFVLCGYDEKQFNRSLVPAILNHVPAGTSTKTLVHYAQEIDNEGEFQQFDYGIEGNLRQYGMSRAPRYRVQRITLPIALLSANNDLVSSNEDVKRLYDELPNPIEHYKVPYEKFNHIDFLWGIDAPSLVYDKLLQLLENSYKSEK